MIKVGEGKSENNLKTGQEIEELSHADLLVMAAGIRLRLGLPPAFSSKLLC